jgi:adenylate kinase
MNSNGTKNAITRDMNIIFFGPPGVGKGTQAELLADRLGIPHISTGAIFRAAVAEGSALGAKAKSYMESGELVPDEITMAIVAEALKRPENGAGFILDGYPRTLAQAEGLATALDMADREIDRVICLNAPDAEITGRMLSRGRADDTAEVIGNRLAIYRDETAPVFKFYSDRGLTVEINGVGEIDEVHDRVYAATKVGAES